MILLAAMAGMFLSCSEPLVTETFVRSSQRDADGCYRYCMDMSDSLSSYSLYTSFTIASTVWSSSNPSVVTVGDQEPTSCQLTANAPGTATISGVVTLRVDSQEGVLTFTDNVSFQVTVSAS